jgi:hypothetical protein
LFTAWSEHIDASATHQDGFTPNYEPSDDYAYEDRPAVNA